MDTTTPTPEAPTFKGYTMQEAYDKVCGHLIKQKRRAMQDKATTGSTGCAYRGINGTMCGIGCLIPDEMMPKVTEGRGIMAQPYEVRDALMPDESREVAGEFMAKLQDVHDNAEDRGRDQGQNIALKLKYIAEEYELKPGAEAKLAKVNWKG